VARKSHVFQIKKWLTLGIFASLVLAFIGLGFVFVPGPHGQERRISFPKGVSLTFIADDLARQNLIHNGFVFRLLARLSGQASQMRAGEYDVPAGASMAAVLQILTTGDSVLHAVVVPEGLTSQQVVKLIAELAVLNGDVDVPAEGSLLSETYHIARGTMRVDFIAQMQKAQSDVLAALWPKRDANLPIKTPQEALILASIVEKETALDSERPLIAAVFINRLRKNMRLQSDPTIIYGLVGGVGTLGRPIRRSEIRRQTAYNTYRIDGLPPTPIANPGRAAIAAVLNPATTKALYFVADGSGGHVFADNLKSHERNVKKWRQIRGTGR
jgi:UPF0755 protein